MSTQKDEKEQTKYKFEIHPFSTLHPPEKRYKNEKKVKCEVGFFYV